jgi:L-Ala-D/L-Glu epimerase / N-acetyl-D-glutamate racemase
VAFWTVRSGRIARTAIGGALRPKPATFGETLMNIRRLTAYVVRLPLKRPFTHATATRQDSENVFVRCELDDCTVGWGEGVPREYVTGETPDGCLEQLALTPVAQQLSADCNSWSDVIAVCERFQPAPVRADPRGCYGNALRCAVELSILDAFGQLMHEPVSAVTGHFEPAAEIRAIQKDVSYSAVIDAGGRHLRRDAFARRIYGFEHCKVKVGREGDDDASRLRTIRRWMGWDVDLRLDVNGGWQPDEVLEKLEPLLRCRISCLEQPVSHDNVSALTKLRRQISVLVMLDESLTGLLDAQAAVRDHTCDMFNIRLSKCGGFLASLRLAAYAKDVGHGYQLGCHPGESGVLSAAGRHWACTVGRIHYHEGSYDRHVFNQLITNEDMTFGYGGRAPALAKPGLGVTIDTAGLAGLTIAQRDFPVV